MKTIEILLNNASQINLDLTEETNKLCIIRQWCKLSEKVLSCKRKPSINAVQNLKTLIDKIKYPHNEVRRNIL